MVQQLMAVVGPDVETCNVMMGFYSGHVDDGEAVDIGSHPLPLMSNNDCQGDYTNNNKVRKGGLKRKLFEDKVFVSFYFNFA